jgi:hypothetical protein
MDKNEQKRFRELWDYAKSNYSLPGNGMFWFGNWVEELYKHKPEDYKVIGFAYESVLFLTRKSYFICGLDGWVERFVEEEIKRVS